MSMIRKREIYYYDNFVERDKEIEKALKKDNKVIAKSNILNNNNKEEFGFMIEFLEKRD